MLRALQMRAVAALAVATLRRADPARRAAFRARDAFYREVWEAACVRCAATCRDLGDSLLEIEWQGVRRYVLRNYTPLDDPVVLRVAGHKGIVLDKLADASLPVPRHQPFRLESLDAAEAFRGTVAAPCVVKPLSGSSAGAGVIPWTRSRGQLVAAAVAIAGLGRDLLIEEQVEGQNLRLLYLDGELLDAVLRRPPAVTGDGRSSIRRLIEDQNRRRTQEGARFAQVQLSIDEDAHRTLHAQGLNLRTVPDAGQSVRVKTAVNDNCAEENVAVRERIGPTLVEEGRRAAAAIGVRLAGVDVITPDFSRGLNEAGGVVLEVNTTPGFHLHYHRTGEPAEVADAVLRRMFEPCPQGGPS